MEIFGSNDQVVNSGSLSCSIPFRVFSVDDAYSSLTLPILQLTVSDDDISGIAVTTSKTAPLTLTEGDTASDVVITFNMLSKASSSVTVSLDLSGSGCSRLSASPNLVTLTYGSSQTMKLSVIDDKIVNSSNTCTISFTSSSGDAAYSGKTPFANSIASLSLTLVDNDQAGLILSLASGTMAEGTSLLATISLRYVNTLEMFRVFLD
jgi:hypothetical protein